MADEDKDIGGFQTRTSDSSVINGGSQIKKNQGEILHIFNQKRNFEEKNNKK